MKPKKKQAAKEASTKEPMRGICFLGDPEPFRDVLQLPVIAYRDSKRGIINMPGTIKLSRDQAEELAYKILLQSRKVWERE